MELKEVIQQLGETHKEFKDQIEQRFKDLEKGKSVADIEAKLEKMNDRFDELEGIKTAIEEMEKKGNRPGDTNKHVEEHKKGFEAFMRKGVEDGLQELERKAVNVGVEAEGGFAVPDDLDRQIEQMERDAIIMRQAATVITVGNESYRKLINNGGASSGWVGETDPRPETSTPTLGEFKPSFGEIYANPAATQKSLEDTFFNVEQWLSSEVAQEFAEQEELAFTMGDGVGKPKGFLSYAMATTEDGSRPYGTLQYRLSGADSALGASDEAAINNIIDLTYDLRAGYRGGASFMISRAILRQVRKLRDPALGMVWQPSLTAGQPSQLLSYPLLENEAMPAPAADSNSIAFGNFKRGYLILDVRGTRILRDPFTNKPYVHFYTTKRVGGGLVNSQAIKVLRLGAAAV